MDFVIAVKSEPNRKARVTDVNRVTLLLSSSSEVTDTTILHRDAVYNSKLQGTCFSCSKLNANPPADVCDPPISDPPPSSSCLNFDVPCACANCPPPPDSRECACTGGYPLPNTTGLGSGYWVGLQANTYYSNVVNGGWVVAVGCASSQIIGAFPVTGNKFGYGRGTVMGLSAMIYPAGALFGAGYEPSYETSFPILALIPDDGNVLITSGAFGSIATGSTSPGCPTTNPQYYCSPDNTTVYAGFPKACVAKYNGDNNSPCTVFANYTAWTDGLPYDTTDDTINGGGGYMINMAGVTGFNGETTGVIRFQDSSSNEYCGTITDFIPRASDAISGVCGATMFPDNPIDFTDDCVSCGQKVPCEYVVNLTNGSIDIDHGGFNAAGSSGFQSIGPAFPPELDASGDFTNTEYWEDFWRWSPETHVYTTANLDENDNPITINTIIPPIESLEANCTCSVGEQNLNSIVIVETFPCCEGKFYGGTPTAQIIQKNMVPGLSGCGGYCPPPCVNPDCSCVGNTDNALGQVKSYGYVPCFLCECDKTEVVYTPQPSSIWWASGIDAHSSVVYNAGSAQILPPGSCKNRCSNLLSNTSGYCSSPSGQLFNVDNSTTPPTVTLNLTRFKESSGFDTPQDLLDDPCGRSKYLPASLQNDTLTYHENPTFVVMNPYSLSDYITNDSGEVLSEILCADPLSPDCFLNNISGPFGIAYYDAGGLGGNPLPSRTCYGVSIGLFIGCAIPKVEPKISFDCDDVCIVVDGTVFHEIKNEKCFDPLKPQNLLPADDARITNPCSCCNEGIEEGDISCSGSDDNPCPPCCQGAGCVNGDCQPGVTPSNNSCVPIPVVEC